MFDSDFDDEEESYVKKNSKPKNKKKRREPIYRENDQMDFVFDVMETITPDWADD